MLEVVTTSTSVKVVELEQLPGIAFEKKEGRKEGSDGSK